MGWGWIPGTFRARGHNRARRRLVVLTLVLVLGVEAPGLAAQPGSVDPVLVAAGDIACDPNNPSFGGGFGTATECRMMAVSDRLVAMQPTAIATLGDNQYVDGGFGKWVASFDRTWGRLKGRIRPAAGNHDYGVAGAERYFHYFGSVAGDPRRGYYSYELGAWHVVVLNSNCEAIGGCGWQSPQLGWLGSDLANHPAHCTLAYWHHPRWSSGQHGDDPTFGPIWEVLYRYGVDVVLNGHDHHYERFAPQNPSGRYDPRRGIREFVVGTGGASHYELRRIQPNSWSRNTTAFGALRLTLHEGSYGWRFVPEAGKSFTDTGTTPCH